MLTRLRTYFLLALLLAACTPATPAPPNPFLGNTSAPGTAGAPSLQAETPIPVEPTETPPPPTPTPVNSTSQLLAYVSDGQLLVTDISGGKIGGTTQYTEAGRNDKVTDVQWSPSGDFIAFTAAPAGDPHIFYVFARGAGTPTDLGPGSEPAWSPDSKSIAFAGGKYPDENIVITPIDNPSPRQITTMKNHAWGRPVFTPDGKALIVAGADRNNMGAQGNTTYSLERLARDSGVPEPLPHVISVEGARLPFDLRFSPNGALMAFSTSTHLSACASPGAYHVSDADGSKPLQVLSPSLSPAANDGQQRYYEGLGYAWTPGSDGLLITGSVIDCDPNSPTMGQAVAGPQMSFVTLDGSEGTIIPGMFYSPSIDRTGRLVAAARVKDLSDTDPQVEVYSGENGQSLMKIGPGVLPQLQP